MSREVLLPPLQKMDMSRIYRVNFMREEDNANSMMEPSRKGTEYIEDDLYGIDDEYEDDKLQVEQIENSQFQLFMKIAQPFYGGLIGFKGSTKRRIEFETKTEIYIPRSKIGAFGHANREDVRITGQSRRSVCMAYRRINMLISSLRKRMSITHFVCVPLNNVAVKNNFAVFKEQVLAENFPGIDEQLFQKEDKLHLTLGIFVLLDDNERARAVEILHLCRPFLTDIKIPFHINIRGLEIMNDDPSAVRVLYACIDAPDLGHFADRAFNFFLKSGLACNKYDRETVKMHMTVMNNRYRKQVNRQAPESFDARDILKRFGTFDFGSAQCTEVRLCAIGLSEEKTAAYKVTAILQF